MASRNLNFQGAIAYLNTVSALQLEGFAGACEAKLAQLEVEADAGAAADSEVVGSTQGNMRGLLDWVNCLGPLAAGATESEQQIHAEDVRQLVALHATALRRQTAAGTTPEKRAEEAEQREHRAKKERDERQAERAASLNKPKERQDESAAEHAAAEAAATEGAAEETRRQRRRREAAETQAKADAEAKAADAQAEAPAPAPEAPPAAADKAAKPDKPPK